MKNYYMDRNENKNITGIHARPQYEGHEKLKETSKEVVAFQENRKQTLQNATEIAQKIYAKMRQMATDALKKEGELPSDFEG